MITIWIVSIFFVIYGTLGLFGIHKVPAKHKGKEYEAEYKKGQGIAYLVGGVPWLLACIVLNGSNVSTGNEILILAVLAFPGIAYSIWQEKKYKNKC